MKALAELALYAGLAIAGFLAFKAEKKWGSR